MYLRTIQAAALKSVFEVLKDIINDVNVYFDAKGVHILTLDTARVRDKACRFMLERYAREKAQGGFAIYMGDEEEGTLRPLA